MTKNIHRYQRLKEVEHDSIKTLGVLLDDMDASDEQARWKCVHAALQNQKFQIERAMRSEQDSWSARIDILHMKEKLKRLDKPNVHPNITAIFACVASIVALVGAILI